MDVEDYRRAGAESCHFLDEDREGDVVEAGAPVGLGHEDAEQAEPGGLVNQVTREFASLIDGLGAWLDLPLGEIPDQPPDLLLFRAEREIHQFTRMMVASPCAIPEQIPAAPEPPPRRRSS